MKRQRRALALAAAAGLAASATASAQFTIRTGLPGTFTDISAIGVDITSGDDSSAPFTSSVTNALVTNPNLWASTNGVISDTEFAEYFNTTIPVGGLGFALLPFWDDLYVETGIGRLMHAMVVEGGVNVHVIQWSRVRTFGGGSGSPTGSFQVKIFASGPVYAQFIYDDITFAANGASATVGFQASAFSFEQFSYNTPNISNGMVLSIVQGVSGACCLTSGCSLLTANGCASAGGIYRGDNTTCPSNCPLPWQEQGDAGDRPATAQFVTGTGPLIGINGTNGPSDTDVYAIQITDSANFQASTVNTGTPYDTMLWLFDATGHGVVGNDDAQGTLQSTLTSQFIPGNGLYYLGFTRFYRVPIDAGGQQLWDFFTPEQRPNGPGAPNEVGGWFGEAGDGGAYTIALRGAGFVEPSTVGACCLPDGACVLNTSAGCSAASGIYRGNGTTCPANCPQPPSGACCLDTGCFIRTAAQCTAAGGTYRGDNSTCGTANCPAPTAVVEQGDAGNLPGTAQVASAPTSSPLMVIRGNLGSGGVDADMYRIRICDSGSFSATTDDPGTAVGDTQLFLFDSTGHGVTFNDDDPQQIGGLLSRLSSQFIPGNGEYFIAVSSYDGDALGESSFGEIWLDTDPTTQTFDTERRPDGPAAGEAVGSWDQNGFDTGNYVIALTGACFIASGPACYPDCNQDHALNVNDFVCFQTAFAGGNLAQADCNRDTMLNVNDFVCFQAAFAAGCSQL